MNGATAVVWIVAILCLTLVIVCLLATFGPKGRLPRARESNLRAMPGVRANVERPRPSPAGSHMTPPPASRAPRPRPDTPNPGVSERPGHP
jgi:hypothetical protein